MVENKTTFESASSFSLGDSVSVVSHTVSDLNTISSGASSAEIGGSGILILDGESTTLKDDNESSSVLSFPSTDDLPSEIGSIQEAGSSLGNLTFRGSNSLKNNKIKVWLLVSSLVAVMSIGLYEWNYWRSSSLKLQQEVQEAKETIARMEREAEEARLLSKNDRIDYSSKDDSGYYTLVDNCWASAKVRWCDKKDPSSPSSSLPLLFGDVIGEAGKVMTEKIQEFKEGVKEVHGLASSECNAASETMNQIFGSGGEAVASELQDFIKDPLEYFATAVRGASHSNESPKVTSKGSQGTLDTFSSFSDELGEALKQALNKVTDFLEEPSERLDDINV